MLAALVFEKDPVIAMDLREILAEACPSAEIEVAETAEQVREVLRTRSHLTHAFLHVPKDNNCLTLLAETARIADRLILLGRDEVGFAVEGAKAVVALAFPFTPADVVLALTANRPTA